MKCPNICCWQQNGWLHKDDGSCDHVEHDSAFVKKCAQHGPLSRYLELVERDCRIDYTGVLVERYFSETGQKAMYRKKGVDYHTLRYVQWLEDKVEAACRCKSPSGQA
jgi:hypothetical protein